MKKIILASAIMLAMSACETSTSASGDSGSNGGSNGGTVNGYSCSVSRTDNSVSVNETYVMGTYNQTQTVYVDSQGYEYSVFTTDITYTDPVEAAEDCADEKLEAREWKDGSYQVECTSNAVHVRQRDDSSRADMEGTAREFQHICDEGYVRAKNGTLGD